MRFLDRILGQSQATKNGLPPDIKAIFEKLYAHLTDEAAQNARLPEELRKMVEGGLGVDGLPGSKGEFGRALTNPIPVNGPIGELIYLSSLVSLNGSGLLAHRLGSLHRHDVYETVTLDGLHWDLLFFSFYHPRKSRKAPEGLKIAPERARLWSATNAYVAKFPLDMPEAASSSSKQFLGLAFASPEIRKALGLRKFVRPSTQTSKLADVKSQGLTPAGMFNELR